MPGGKKDLGLKIAATLFALVAVAHLLRVLIGLDFGISGTVY